MYDAIDDFAGPGGWDVGAEMLGLRLYGIDHDHAACETARAAGFIREQADITAHASPSWARGKGYVSSPSCTLFSMAGSGIGRLVMDALASGINRIFNGDDPATVRTETQAAIYPVALAARRKAEAKRKPEKQWGTEKVEAKARLDAKIAALVLEVVRRIMELDPEWVALEQVPEVLPLWELIARRLGERGYSAFALILNSADFGVPQTRRRAILGASRVRQIAPPAPTHTELPQGDDLFGVSLQKWVSMADALGWGWEDEPSCTVSSGGAETGGAEPFANAGYRQRLSEYVLDRRTNSKGAGGSMVPTVPVSTDRPAPTVTGAGNFIWAQRRDSGPGAEREPRPIDQPSHTIRAAGLGKAPAGVAWVFERPATTVVGSFKPDVIAAPGYRTDISRQDAPGSVSVSVSEAGVLQSFRPDYPWQGAKGKQHEQVGNAIPPLLAAHALHAITGAAFVQEKAA